VTATLPVVRAAPAIALLLFGVSASSAGSPRQYEDYHDSAIRPSDSPPRPRGHLKKLHLEMGGVFLLPPISTTSAGRERFLVIWHSQKRCGPVTTQDFR